MSRKTNQQPQTEQFQTNVSNETPAGAPFNDQDPKRRLGNFSGAGEHPRQVGRGRGNRDRPKSSD